MTMNFLPNQYIRDNTLPINHNYLQRQFSDHAEIFADIKKGKDIIRVYNMHLQSIKIYLPFYQSWDEETFVKNFDWIIIRFSFN